ncbi:hypothetical protein M2C68_22320, partial [Pseudomonas sp. BAgro211]|nr:hypothetical protein [Pseudomonas sp. BAgro211]
MSLRPCLLVTAILLATSSAIAAETVRDYQVPAGPLASTLNRIAAEAGLSLSLDPALAQGRNAHAVQGRYDAAGALRQA